MRRGGEIEDLSGEGGHQVLQLQLPGEFAHGLEKIFFLLLLLKLQVLRRNTQSPSVAPRRIPCTLRFAAVHPLKLMPLFGPPETGTGEEETSTKGRVGAGERRREGVPGSPTAPPEICSKVASISCPSPLPLLRESCASPPAAAGHKTEAGWVSARA